MLLVVCNFEFYDCEGYFILFLVCNKYIYSVINNINWLVLKNLIG